MNIVSYGKVWENVLKISLKWHDSDLNILENNYYWLINKKINIKTDR